MKWKHEKRIDEIMKQIKPQLIPQRHKDNIDSIREFYIMPFVLGKSMEGILRMFDDSSGELKLAGGYHLILDMYAYHFM